MRLARGPVLATHGAVGTAACHYWPRWVAPVWLLAGLVVLTFANGCRRGVPVIDTAPKPPDARGTITGIVRGPEGTSPMAGRTVQITNVDTGERHEVKTGATGGFTIELPAGKYRLDLPLKDGEAILKRPDVVKLDRGDIDSHIEFIVTAARALRPGGPAYRVDNGLGSPVA